MTTYNSDGIPTHNSKILVSSASGVAAYADTLPIPTSDPNNRKGWYYQKTAGAEKFNYYLYVQGSRALRLQDVKEFYFVGAVDTYTNATSVPFIVIYTKPLGDGQDAQPWYRSRITHGVNIVNTNIQLGVKSQFSTAEKTSTKFPYSQSHLSVKTGEGPRDPTEEILYMTIHCDSGAPNDAKILISHFGYCLHNRAEDVNILLSA